MHLFSPEINSKFLLCAGLSLTCFGAEAFTLNSSSDSGLKGWSDHNVTFHLNPANCPSNIDGILTDAMSAWNNVPTSDVVVSRGGDTTTTYADLNGNTFHDIPVIICDTNFSADSGLGGNGIAGVAKVGVPPSGGNISFAFLLVNVETGSTGNVANADSTLVKIVLAHEMGHVLGLGHSQDTKALMYYNASAKTSFTLAQDDVDGITYLYPRNELGKQFMGCGSVANRLFPPRPPRPPLVILFFLLPVIVYLGLRRWTYRSTSIKT
jgi:hypothetical protein